MPVATQLTPQQIIDQIPCAPCLPDGMKLDALIYVIQQLAGTSYTPQQLMDLAKCNKCMPVGMKLDVVIALLDQLAKCAALSGSGDPTGSVTPQFIGQLYHDTTADTYYRSTGLTSADWVAISGGGGPPLMVSVPAGKEQSFGLALFGDVPGLTSFVWNGVHTLAGFDLSYTVSLTSLSFPNLIDVDPTNSQGGYMNLSYHAALVSISLPLLTTVAGTLSAHDNPLLTTLDVPSWVPTDSTTYNLSNNAFVSTTVELLLRRFVLASVSLCTILLNGGTNAGVASLNAQGQADAATLGAQLFINP